MCGIAGILSLDGKRPVDVPALHAMREAMWHRGPDSAGQVAAGPVGLAMRRLAIIDVQGGEQPLTNEDGRIHVVCNGEIYNYRELRAELAGRGHAFRTGSDCEVIVHAYEEYGDDFLTRLNGMFGLALWDGARARLVLARDRAGIKPLYYAEHDGRLLFASEPKAILAYPGFPRSLDPHSLNQYLTYEYVPSPRSIFAGMAKVRPGHTLIVEGGRKVEGPYWRLDLTPAPQPSGVSTDDLADQLWQRIREAVRLEMVSDVPIGVFLSGGIDSSAIAAAMTEISPGSVRSFSIGFVDPTFDEAGFARQVASYLGTDHSESILDPDAVWDLVPRVAEFLDEPLADGSIIPTYLLSRFTRRHVTVALGGDGGDELFAGYSTLQAHQIAGYYRRVPAFVREGLVAPIVRRLPVSDNNMSFDFKAKRFIMGLDRPVAERHHRWLGAYSPEEKGRLLRPEIRAELRSAGTFDVLDEHLLASGSSDALSQVLYLDMKMYLEGDILVKVDRASMGCSLEVRVPFLNTVLIDWATRLPLGLKFRGLTRKYLLRRAVAGRLPDSIVRRPKKGFGFPLTKWLRHELRPLLLDLLSPEAIQRQGLFDAGYVERLVADHLAKRQDNRKYLWTLLMFQLWHERFLASAQPAACARR